jgi:hypothetical protein
MQAWNRGLFLLLIEKGIERIHREQRHPHSYATTPRDKRSCGSGGAGDGSLVVDKTLPDAAMATGFCCDLLLDDGLDQVSWPVDVDAAADCERVGQQL